MSESEPLQLALKAKEAGNQHYKRGDYSEAVKCYTEAISLGPQGHQESAVFLKNRSACWLKMEKYEKALSDATAALSITPMDVKSLYRSAQAMEGLGDLAGAFKATKQVLSLEPQNRDALETARRLATAMRKQAEMTQSTDRIIDDMFTALGTRETPKDRRIQAAKNFAILSRESSGAEKILHAGGLSRLLALLDPSEPPELVHHVLETFVGLCSANRTRAFTVVQQLSLEKLSLLISSPHSAVSASAVSVLKHALLAAVGEDNQPPKDAESAIAVAENAFIIAIAQMLFILLVSRDVSAEARDHILELLTQTVAQGNLGELYLKEGLVTRLLILVSGTVQSSSREVKLPCSEETRMNVSMVLCKLYESFGRNKELKEGFEKECGAFVLSHLSQEDGQTQVQGLTALTAIIQGTIEVGNAIFSETTVLGRMVEMAESDNLTCQIVAAEALALAASDKDRCLSIMTKGLPVLKALYAAPDDRVRVRALVGLCKLGSVGGSNVNARTFTEGSTVKLEKTCRKFLVSTKKEEGLRKWAAEGLAFLTLDAEVKETLMADQPALKMLMRLVQSKDQSLLYGIVTIFVNLTNSYDKPERNPELDELGRYAGENVPKEHELDGEEYVKKRVASLLEMGVVSALVVVDSADSERVHEQVARVFLALTQEVSHRGHVIQQGGAKRLVSLALTNTDKGKLFAAQALAKIGITNDPRLAFPGQRSLEVIRPLVQLLKSESGLQNFEGLMALTNLAAMNDDVRRRIVKEGGVPLMESLMFEEHELIRRASTEVLCNLISLPEVHERFYGDDVERVKLWMLFSGEEDPALAKAASGGLAQLSHDPKICEKIMEVKSSIEILKELVASTDEELQYRGTYILANLIDAKREIAEKLIETELLEVLLALSQREQTPGKTKEAADRALGKAAEYKLIKRNPELDV